MVIACLVAGCTRAAGKQAKSYSEGIPVRVGTQDINGLPVELQTNKPLPVEARLQIDERMPVELVVMENKPLPVKAQIRADEPLPVKLIPDRAIWIAIAIAGLMAFFTMVAAVASCRAAVNAKRAADKQGD
ncbi:MAG: hypothetical protein ABII09_10445 [Planctomycetota bacterium]